MKAKLLNQGLVYTLIMAMLFSLMLSNPKESQAKVDVSAQAAILMDVESGRILYEKNADQPLRIASITKIMTAIIALELGDLKDKVTASRNAVGKEGSSIYLRLGETLTLEDLLYGLMLRSGNDAAVAIAEHIGGSVEGFVFLMNQRAEELGMTGTVFSNPHGLDDHEEHYSTARDMAILTAYALKNKEFAKIAKTKRKTAPLAGESWDRVWHNKNKLLHMYPYADGVKTGYTKRAKRTLVSSATKDGHQLVAVTLNAPDDWNDHIKLFDYGFNQFTKVTLTRQKEKISDERFLHQHGYFQATRSFSYPLSKMERIRREHVVHPELEQRVLNGETLPYPAGYLIFSLENNEIGRVPLEFVVKQMSPSFWQRISFVIANVVGGPFHG